VGYTEHIFNKLNNYNRSVKCNETQDYIKEAKSWVMCVIDDETRVITKPLKTTSFKKAYRTTVYESCEIKSRSRFTSE
jgi:hypothetical protein